MILAFGFLALIVQAKFLRHSGAAWLTTYIIFQFDRQLHGNGMIPQFYKFSKEYVPELFPSNPFVFLLEHARDDAIKDCLLQVAKQPRNKSTTCMLTLQNFLSIQTASDYWLVLCDNHKNVIAACLLGKPPLRMIGYAPGHAPKLKPKTVSVEWSSIDSGNIYLGVIRIDEPYGYLEDIIKISDATLVVFPKELSVPETSSESHEDFMPLSGTDGEDLPPSAPR